MPGVVLDRVDVGGSDTGQQSLVISRGDPGPGAVWRLDGVDVTDPAALGSLSIYPDMEALSLVEVRTSALDVRVRTPGVQAGLFTRDPGPRWSGRLHARATGPQSDNRPADLLGRSLVAQRHGARDRAGRRRGGPLAGDRFGSGEPGTHRRAASAVHGPRRPAAHDRPHPARPRPLGPGTLSVLGLRAEKIDEDRDVTLSASPESRWRQSGPTRLLAIEDRRPVGSVSLLTRISYLDAGFRLAPRGGMSESAFEDFRGVFERSYQRFETRRPRFEAGLEAAAARRGLGFAHVLVAGGGYHRSVVTTESRWPGNQVLAFERQSVFFRAFGLTGFALPTRAQSARSLQEGWEAYAQDDARRGRLGITAGLRLDRLAGRNLASSVEANPAFPDLLPAARYDGGPTEIRWRDLLPRAGFSWDLGRDGGLVARLGYAAYAAPLGAADVTFDNPIGREGASLTYYWIDRNGDHTVDPGELDPIRGLLAASGVDPASPALAAPRTSSPRPARAAHARGLGGAGARPRATVAGTVQLSYRRLVDPLCVRCAGSRSPTTRSAEPCAAR